MFVTLLAVALGAAPGPERILPASLRVERLNNGLTIVLAPYRSHGVVAFDTLVRAGSRDETADMPTGVAHLLEHLLFRGSAGAPAGQLEQRLQQLGVDANAETDADATLFADLAPRESLPALIDLEAARLQHLEVTEAATSVEAGAIRSEAEARTADADAQLLQAVDRAAFPGQPYGRPVIGEAADLAQLHALASAARELYRRAYRPEATTLVIAGDFEPEQTLARVRREYGRWRPRGAAKGPSADHGQKPASNAGAAAQPEVAIAFRGPPAATPRDAAAIQVLAEVLGGPLSPLHAHLVQDRALAERVDVEAVRRRDAVLLVFALGAAEPSELTGLEHALESELRSIRAGSLEPRIAEQARSALLHRAALRFEAPGVLARAIALESATSGRPEALAQLESALADVTVADVLAAARARLVPEARVSVALGPGVAAR